MTENTTQPGLDLDKPRPITGEMTCLRLLQDEGPLQHSDRDPSLWCRSYSAGWLCLTTQDVQDFAARGLARIELVDGRELVTITPAGERAAR